jgi:AraC-like DNA-binding protein
MMVSSSLKIETSAIAKCICNLEVLSGLQIEVFYLDGSIHGGTFIDSDFKGYLNIETIILSIEIANSENAQAKIHIRSDFSVSIEVILFDHVLFVPIAVIYIAKVDNVQIDISSCDTKHITSSSNKSEIFEEIKGTKKLIALSELVLTIADHIIAKGMITKREDTVGRIVDYIRININNEINADILARELFLSKNGIYSAIKNEFGMTLGQYIQVARLDKASQMLLTTDKSIMEISEQCGIDDFNYFSRLFRKNFGLSPTTYRKKFA